MSRIGLLMVAFSHLGLQQMIMNLSTISNHIHGHGALGLR